MAIDLSFLGSISSLLGSSYGTQTTTKPTVNFEDYLMNALGTQKTNEQNSTNGLYDAISNSGNTSLLTGLMSSGTGSDTAANALSGFDVYSTLTSNNNTSTSYGTSASSSAVFSDYLTNSFQSTMMKNMNSAKAKLQMSYNDYVARVGDNPSDASKLRMQQMEQNIAAVDNFMTNKSSTTNSNASNSLENKLSSLLGKSTSVNAADLLSQLQGNSTLLDALTNTSSNKNNDSTQSLLNQLTATGTYYQNKLNS